MMRAVSSEDPRVVGVVAVMCLARCVGAGSLYYQWLWMSGSKVRRQRRAYREALAAKSAQPDQAGHPAGDAVTAVGEETLAVSDGAQPAAEDRPNPR